MTSTTQPRIMSIRTNSQTGTRLPPPSSVSFSAAVSSSRIKAGSVSKAASVSWGKSGKDRKSTDIVMIIRKMSSVFSVPLPENIYKAFFQPSPPFISLLFLLIKYFFHFFMQNHQDIKDLYSVCVIISVKAILKTTLICP